MSAGKLNLEQQKVPRILKRMLGMGLRLGVCGLLMAWIFHAIFYFEIQQPPQPEGWDAMSRVERWRMAWTRGPVQLGRTLSHISPVALVASLGVMGLILLTGVARWRRVLRVQGLELSWARAIEISLVSHFFNSFLLGSTGGDVLRAIYTARETHHKKTEAVVTVFVDRILGLWTLLLFGCLMMLPNLTLILAHRYLPLICLTVVAMALGCSGVVLLALRGGVSRGWGGARAFLRRLPKGEALERSLDACRKFGREPSFLWQTIAISMVLNGLCVLHVQVLANGLEIPTPPSLTAMVVPVITALIAVPITPSGLGIRENLFVYILGDPTIGINATSAFALSLLAYGGSLFWSLLGGLVYLTFRRKHHLAEAALEAPTDDSLPIP